MNFQENVSLADYSTMALGGNVSYLVEVASREELQKALDFAKEKSLPSIMIGSGSNIIWRNQDFVGLVIVNNIKGFEIKHQSSSTYIVKIGSGEIWDEVVERCVSKGLSGVEALSLVPGKAGAVPVQNVGAYGQEIADTFISLEAYDNKTKEFVVIPNENCGFGYRTSRFKTTDHGRFFITSISLRLKKTNPQPPFYMTLSDYLDEHGITEYNPEVVRQAVIDIRSHKLPDPKVIHNTGSFFANPVISTGKYKTLSQTYPNMPGWSAGEGKIKVPAAWLIESAGFKNYHDKKTGMATWPMQPLVLVNEHANSTHDLLAFKEKITTAIKDKFGIELIQEPELLP